MNRNKLIAMFLVTFLVASIGTAIASSPVVDIGDGQIDILGSTTTVNILLNEAPNGFSGYNLTVSLSNPSIAEIVSVSYPSWATLHDNSTLPANSVWMKAVDLNDQVKSGDMNILLGTLMIRGDSQGESNIIATVTKMDDDNGYPINTSIDSGHLEVGEVGGPTYVSGIISFDTTWTATDSPYVVTGSILVEEGVTLTIEPGVLIKFNSGKGIRIDGELIARGTETESIVFTSNQSSPAPGDWVNILFTDGSVDAVFDEDENCLNGSIMQYCTVEYGGGVDNPVLKIVSSSPYINHCIITNNGNSGIYVSDGSLKITNNVINENSPECGDENTPEYGGGIYISSGTVNISGNTISNNVAHGRFTHYIGYGGGIYIGSGTVTITNNTISSNRASSRWQDTPGYGGGIYIGGGTVTISNNSISDNEAHGHRSRGGGIYIGSGTVTVSNNIISNNEVAGFSCYGGGIYISSGAVIISHNEITGNTAAGFYYYISHGSGVYTQGNNVNISYNKITGNNCTCTEEGSGSGVQIKGQPIIRYNNIFNNTPYDVGNLNDALSPAVNCTNNWWETTDEPTIQAHISDWYDDASLGIVDYNPYLTEPVTLENMPPIASFTYSPENPVVNEAIVFNASSSYDSDGVITNYEWDFDDGTNGTGEVVTHLFSSAGNYMVTLTVTDNDNAMNSTTKTVTVIPRYEVKSVILSLNKTTALFGTSIPASLSIQNTGNVNTAAFLTGHMNSTSFTITPSETSVIPVGSTIEHAFDFTVPDIPSKTYTLSIEVGPVDKPVTDAISTSFNVLNVTGTLTVITTPRGANVTVEGGVPGTYPYEQILDSGTYVLHIRKLGYICIDDTVVVIAGERTVKSYTLAEEEVQ